MAEANKAASTAKPKQPSTKTLETSRKQTGSPVDQSSRKQSLPPTRAWQGPNPITSRTSNNTSPLANGLERSSQRSAARSNNDAHIDKHAHDRLLFLLANMTGYDATLTLKNGEQFSGVFAGGSFDSAAKSIYTLKMVKRIRLPSQQVNGNVELADEHVGEGEDHVASFDIQDTVDLTVNGVQMSTKTTQNGSASASFRTDTEISGRAPAAPRERELQRWQPGAADMSLDDMALEGGTNGWDQFAVNEQKYGVQTTYDEDIYTTSIDKSHPQYRERMEKAERLAREIEGSTAANSHIADERKKDMIGTDDGDEEDKYSGVRRDAGLTKGGSGSYVPPSRRPITSQPTVPGAPFDPAIIASQVARPGALTAEKPADRKQSTTPVEKVPSPIPAAKISPGTTEDRVRDTADAFKQFANNEKLRLRQAQELKRTNARNEKNVRINDLKKFAENFKLKSRVPDDLVPILAKDHEKQLEIKRKAEEAARLEEQRSKEAPKASSPSQAAPTAPQAGTERASVSSASSRPRVAQASRSQYVPQPLPGMSQRQAQVFNSSKPMPRQPAVSIPTGPAIPAVNPASPAAAAKLNVNAKAFEFRPAASNFTPSGTTPSPQRLPAAAPPAAPTSFLDEKEKAAIASRQNNDETDIDVIHYLIHEAAASLTVEQRKALESTGGVPQPYRTAPTWSLQGRENTSYEDMFPKPQTHGRSPLHTPNGSMPQQFAPQQHRYQYPGYGMPGFAQFAPQMGMPGASVQGSPRGQAPIPFGGQMQMQHMGQFPGQPVPLYSTSPNMANRMLGPQPVMVQPGYGAGSPFRQSYSGGQLPGMMPQGPGFMPHQGFSPMPQNIQPQHVQHFSGSPRNGPPMMQHGSSYQGYQPQMMQYGSPSPYAMSQRQHSTGQFPHATPRQAQAVPAQPLPSPGVNGQVNGQPEDNK